jgi:hypothetical protein
VIVGGLTAHATGLSKRNIPETAMTQLSLLKYLISPSFKKPIDLVRINER